MSGQVRTRAGALRILAVACALFGAAAPAGAQGTPATFKVAFFNIQSGKGEPALPGRAGNITDTTNCTDPSLPLNAWGTGMVQAHLTDSVGNDPTVVALGLAESWASVCGSPENVRKALGWKSRTSERNGVAMVARYGFAGPEEWQQLDTSLNTSPADTMWALRIPVCLDATCSQSMNMFVAHWYGSGGNKNVSYDRQAQQTVAFIQRTAGSEPHVFTGDLNTWDGTAKVCGTYPNNAGLGHLRAAGYVDAWPLLHGTAEGYTGMTNRAGCGMPEGYAWKRPDYTWAPNFFLPISMTRFGIVPAGDAAPSDHYGIITEFPRPGIIAPPVDVVPPTVAIASPTEGTGVATATLSIAVDAMDNLGVARVEVIEDGVVKHTLTSAPYVVACSSIAATAGAHTISARAFDAAGNVATSDVRHIVVEAPEGPTEPPTAPGEIVLYAKDAAVVAGNWRNEPDTTAAGGARMWNPDAALAKLAAPLASPADYFELTFTAEAGRAYRIWIRGRAEKDYWGNDSAYFQFSDAVNQTGAPLFRIGTTNATWLGVEDCSGCALKGWGWQDNGYGTGVFGPVVYFATSGPQTLRVQRREDGLSIDQIVLSPERYLSEAPGTQTNDTTIIPKVAVVPPPPPSAAEILITSSAVTTVAGGWRVIADASAAGGAAIGHPDAGGAKPAAALAAPVHFVELTFVAEAGREYRLWLRGRADRDGWANDSVFVQFSGSQTAQGQSLARIGTTDAFSVNLEDGVNAGVAGWGWQDNGYGTGVLGPTVSFATTGPQTMRIQTREDGLRIDQIVLSSGTYLTTAPGALKNDTTIIR